MSTSNPHTAAVDAANRALATARLAVEQHPDPLLEPVPRRRAELEESLRVAKGTASDLWSRRSLIEDLATRFDRSTAMREAMRSAIATVRAERDEAAEALAAAKAAHPHHEPSWTREERRVTYLDAVLVAAVSGWGAIEWGNRMPPELAAALPVGFDPANARPLQAIDPYIAELEQQLAEQVARLPVEVPDTKVA